MPARCQLPLPTHAADSLLPAALPEQIGTFSPRDRCLPPSDHATTGPCREARSSTEHRRRKPRGGSLRGTDRFVDKFAVESCSLFEASIGLIAGWELVGKRNRLADPSREIETGSVEARSAKRPLIAAIALSRKRVDSRCERVTLARDPAISVDQAFPIHK